MDAATKMQSMLTAYTNSNN